MENTIPLDEAIAAVNRWKNLANQKLGVDDLILAFKIPVINFTQIIDKGCHSVRGYLAINDAGEKQLFVVGVDAEGHDLIDYDKGYYVYDFSSACPMTCDSSSPLYTN